MHCHQCSSCQVLRRQLAQPHGPSSFHVCDFPSGDFSACASPAPARILPVTTGHAMMCDPSQLVEIVSCISHREITTGPFNCWDAVNCDRLHLRGKGTAGCCIFETGGRRIDWHLGELATCCLNVLRGSRAATGMVQAMARNATDVEFLPSKLAVATTHRPTIVVCQDMLRL